MLGTLTIPKTWNICLLQVHLTKNQALYFWPFYATSGVQYFCHTIFPLQVTFTNKIQNLQVEWSKLASGINLLTLDDTILG